MEGICLFQVVHLHPVPGNVRIMGENFVTYLNILRFTVVEETMTPPLPSISKVHEDLQFTGYSSWCQYQE